MGRGCTGRNQCRGTVLWFQYPFRTQYYELKLRTVGLARLVGGEHMGDAVWGVIADARHASVYHLA